MLVKSDTDISKVILKLQSMNIDACFVVPTKTGMEKSILDATYQIRIFLNDAGFHDYALQKQGSENKRIKKCFFVDKTQLIESKVSLYRPNTKSGDPRIWFYALSKYSKPNNLLALTVIDANLYIINCSDSQLLSNLESNAFAKKLDSKKDTAFQELLQKMSAIYQMGYIKSIGDGDKAVGETLEHCLGIDPNSLKTPDYKGIELKSSRSSRHRSTLFSKTPNWKLSRLKSTKAILEERGVFSPKDNRVALYHTLKADQPNSYHMLLRVDQSEGLLKQNFILDDQESNDVNWLLKDLQQSLARKHPKSFWVKAKTEIKNNSEFFNYFQLIYTHSPNPNYFVALLESGIITVDYLMHLKPNGVARDHGYLFKILPENLESLFPQPKLINLAELS